MEEMPKVQEKDYAIMDLTELEQEPGVMDILQRKALDYLQEVDRKWFEREYTGELNAEGYLIAKDGTENTTPLQNIGGGEALDWVMNATKEELLKDASPEEILRIKAPKIAIAFEKLYAENKDRPSSEYLAELQDLVRTNQDLKLKALLAKTADGLPERVRLNGFDETGKSIIDAFLEYGKEFGIRV